MTAGVNANPDDIRRLAGALSKCEQDVLQAVRSARRALDSAQWHDRQKDQFAARFLELQRSVERFMATEMDGMSKSLTKLATQLDAIRSMRM
jgi:hypothetical protein